MICPICKAETNDNTRFCTKCGKRIPRCPTCGKVVETRARFCVSDGTPLPDEVLALLPEIDAPKAAPEKPPAQKNPAPRRPRFCTQCGGVCEEGQTVCAMCRGTKIPVTPLPSQPPRKAYCIRCGKPCAEGKNLCVECRSGDRSSGRYREQEKKGGGTVLLVGAIVLALLVLIGVALFFIFRGGDEGENQQNEPESTRSYWDADDSFRNDDEEDFVSVETEPVPIAPETEPVEIETESIIETAAPTDAPTEPPVDVNSVEYRMEYFMNNCSSEYFTESYFEGFNAEECRLVRNAIYAHSGRKFNDASLQAYYEQFDWYVPSVDPANFSGSMLNDYQLSNVNAILSFEAAHGYN